MAEEVDLARTERLATEILRCVRQHYLEPPGKPARENILIALNALAVVTTTVIEGTGGAPEAVKFFFDAFAANIASEPVQ